MSAEARWSVALVISVLLSVAILARAIVTFMSAEEMRLYLYVAFVVGTLLILYELPAIVAYRRNHRLFVAILISNILLGWTLLGWVGALVLACSSGFDRKHAEVISAGVHPAVPTRARVAASLIVRYETVFMSGQRA